MFPDSGASKPGILGGSHLRGREKDLDLLRYVWDNRWVSYKSGYRL